MSDVDYIEYFAKQQVKHLDRLIEDSNRRIKKCIENDVKGGHIASMKYDLDVAVAERRGYRKILQEIEMRGDVT